MWISISWIHFSKWLSWKAIRGFTWFVSVIKLVLNLEHIFYTGYRHTHEIIFCPISMTLLKHALQSSSFNIHVLNSTKCLNANTLSTTFLLKTENVDLSWVYLNMMLPSWTNYLLNSFMSISLISLTLTSSSFTAFLISLFLFTKFSRSAYLFRPNFLLVVWENLMIVYHRAV